MASKLLTDQVKLMEMTYPLDPEIRKRMEHNIYIKEFVHEDDEKYLLITEESRIPEDTFGEKYILTNFWSNIYMERLGNGDGFKVIEIYGKQPELDIPYLLIKPAY